MDMQDLGALKAVFFHLETIGKPFPHQAHLLLISREHTVPFGTVGFGKHINNCHFSQLLYSFSRETPSLFHLS